MTEKEKLITEIEAAIREELLRMGNITLGNAAPYPVVTDGKYWRIDELCPGRSRYEKKKVDALKKELIQTGAMAIRNLLYLELRK